MAEWRHPSLQPGFFYAVVAAAAALAVNTVTILPASVMQHLPFFPHGLPVVVVTMMLLPAMHLL